MVAQGLTVVVLLASAGLSAMPAPDGGESEDELKREFREVGTFLRRRRLAG